MYTLKTNCKWQQSCQNERPKKVLHVLQLQFPHDFQKENLLQIYMQFKWILKSKTANISKISNNNKIKSLTNGTYFVLFPFLHKLHSSTFNVKLTTIYKICVQIKIFTIHWLNISVKSYRSLTVIWSKLPRKRLLQNWICIVVHWIKFQFQQNETVIYK